MYIRLEFSIFYDTMPDSSLDSPTSNPYRTDAKYEPGYDWVPGRFGPPPGILKSKKDQLGE